MSDFTMRTGTYRALPESLVTFQHGSVTALRLSRPAKRNALDPEMIRGIEAFFSDPPEGTRAIVLFPIIIAARLCRNFKSKNRTRIIELLVSL
jgi:hypothetical protein